MCYHVFIFFIPYRRSNGVVETAGFCDPTNDPSLDDAKIWKIDLTNLPKSMSIANARYILENVADEFCKLYWEEQETKRLNSPEGISQ